MILHVHFDKTVEAAYEHTFFMCPKAVHVWNVCTGLKAESIILTFHTCWISNMFTFSFYQQIFVC